MGVAYIPVIVALYAVLLWLSASILVGAGISTNRFSRSFWRGTQWKRLKRWLRFVAGFIMVCGLSVPVVPFLLLSMIGGVFTAIADYACNGRAWTNKISDWMYAIGAWVVSDGRE